ncbi:MAG: TatD family hydrolase [Prevotellaceae bacterium]|jgi:TatD DNase family protein|nr:TatD family hydrolase [Prevotellaceae bacterium]
MIDTHAHLYSEEFDADRDDTVKRAVEKGVSHIIIPSTSKDDFDAMMKLCNDYAEICFPAVGLHPTSVKDGYVDELAFVEKQLDSNRFVAVGEIGIDCYWSTDYIVQQRDAFEKQVKLAERHNLPVIIHARNSFDEIFSILDRIHNSNVRGVFHGFSGTREDYLKIREYGTFKTGIGGVITFKNSKLPQVMDIIPVTDIVLETDAPYLTPHPYRGQRNESSRIPIIAQKIAELKNISVEEVDQITSENAKTLFHLSPLLPSQQGRRLDTM